MILYKSTSVKACLLCPNRSNVTDCQTNEPLQRITYHKLPVTAERRDRWLEFCGLTKESFASLGFKFVCSNHFEPDCFERDLRSELLGGIKRMLLKKGAMPTIRNNGHGMVPKQNDGEDQRRRKAEVEKLLTGEIPVTTPIVNPFRKHKCDERPSGKRKMAAMNNAHGTDGPQLVHVLSRMSEAEMLQRIAQLEVKTGEQSKLITQLQRTIDKKTEKINLAKAEMVNIAITLQELKEHENQHVNARLKALLCERFSEGQLAVITAGAVESTATTSIQKPWIADDFAKALELRCISMEAFQYLLHHLHYPLPDGLQLEQWIHGIYLETGLSSTALRLLEMRAASLNPIELVCTLNLVHTDAPVRYHYDHRRDQIFGPNSLLQCVAVQGVFSEWIQIVQVGFDVSYSQQMLEEIVTQLYRVGYRVIVITTGCDRYMVDVWNKLAVSSEQHFLTHPITMRSIYVYVCPEQVLSAIHRILLADGFVMQQNNVTITKDALVRLVESVDPRVVRTLKISQRHLSSMILDDAFDCSASRELISQSTSNALKIITNESCDGDMVSTLGTLFDIFIDWHELCTTTSSTRYKDQQQQPSITQLPYGTCEDEQNIVLDGMYDVMENMRCLSADNSYLPAAVLASISSIRKLLHDLREDYPGKINGIPLQRLGSAPMSELLINLRTALRNGNGTSLFSTNEVLVHLCQTVVGDVHGSHVSNSILQLAQLSAQFRPVQRADEPNDPDIRGVTEQNACSFLTHFLAVRLGHKYRYLGERMVKIGCQINEYVFGSGGEAVFGSVKPSALWTEQAKKLESYMAGVEQQRRVQLVENLVNYIHNLHPQMGRDLIQRYVVNRIAIRLQTLNMELCTSSKK